MGFYFMPFTSALVFQRLFFLCNFLEGKDLCFIIVSLLLPVLPQLSCYFHHFKVILLLLVHFSFGFPFCSVVIMFGYLFCCLLVRFFPLDFGPSFYLCVHMPPKSKSFFFSHTYHFVLAVHVLSFVHSMSWMCLLSFPLQSGDSS